MTAKKKGWRSLLGLGGGKAEGPAGAGETTADALPGALTPEGDRPAPPSAEAKPASASPTEGSPPRASNEAAPASSTADPTTAPAASPPAEAPSAAVTEPSPRFEPEPSPKAEPGPGWPEFPSDPIRPIPRKIGEAEKPQETASSEPSPRPLAPLPPPAPAPDAEPFMTRSDLEAELRDLRSELVELRGALDRQIDEKQRLEEEVRQLGDHDPVTGA